MSAVHEPGRPPFLSRALLTGMLLQVPCERATLSAWLSRFGALALGDAGEGEYPVFCEIWHVHDGALAAGRADLPGSGALARVAGTYRECLVWVPDVRWAGGQGLGFAESSFVVGMLTDSALARWADVALGFGYDKRPGRFVLAPDGAAQVRGPSGRVELAFAPSPSPFATAPDVAALDRFAAMPLLGVTRRGAFVQSWLERRFSTAEHRAVGGGLSVSDYLMPGCRRSYAVGVAEDGACALAFFAMRARLTYPRAVPPVA